MVDASWTFGGGSRKGSTPHPTAPVPTYRILLVGDRGVGKTALFGRLHDLQCEDNPADLLGQTVPLDSFTRQYMIDGEKLRVCINDCPGNSGFWASNMHKMYRHVDAVLLMCSVDCTHSLKSISKWKKRCQESLWCDSDSHLVWILVANKSDLHCVIDTGHFCDVCRELDIPMDTSFFHVSTKTGQNVQEVFERTLRQIHRQGQHILYSTQEQTIVIGDDPDDYGEVSVKPIRMCNC